MKQHIACDTVSENAQYFISKTVLRTFIKLTWMNVGVELILLAVKEFFENITKKSKLMIII